MENVSGTETVYRCRTAGQTQTILSIFPKGALDKSMRNVDICHLFSTDPYSVYRPAEIHISDANYQSVQKLVGKMSIYIQLSYRHSRAAAVPVHTVLLSVNTPRCEASGNHAAFL